MIVLDTKVVFCADQKSMVFFNAETRDPKVPNADVFCFKVTSPKGSCEILSSLYVLSVSTLSLVNFSHFDLQNNWPIEMKLGCNVHWIIICKDFF
jgi:hypothetical protein